MDASSPKEQNRGQEVHPGNASTLLEYPSSGGYCCGLCQVGLGGSAAGWAQCSTNHEDTALVPECFELEKGA